MNASNGKALSSKKIERYIKFKHEEQIDLAIKKDRGSEIFYDLTKGQTSSFKAGLRSD
ncbi:4445_t:CDS:2 [Acaulospora colombiana]|uniref:4445_t:CDS:1 n=1 Tax=Acaulospora colombiana TaxID=27376 RepID=A0ACA9KIQ2_9GLOM|nr:4445_t:CDS:2 [Acaulospora colombiana]